MAQRKADEQARCEEEAAKLDQGKIATLRACEQEVKSIDGAIAQLEVLHDLGTVEGALAASEQQAKVSALRELREQADGRLLSAERSMGRHRSGRS